MRKKKWLVKDRPSIGVNVVCASSIMFVSSSSSGPYDLLQRSKRCSLQDEDYMRVGRRRRRRVCVFSINSHTLPNLPPTRNDIFLLRIRRTRPCNNLRRNILKCTAVDRVCTNIAESAHVFCFQLQTNILFILVLFPTTNYTYSNCLEYLTHMMTLSYLNATQTIAKVRGTFCMLHVCPLWAYANEKQRERVC